MAVCSCINSKSILDSFSNCITPSGLPGITSSSFNERLCYPTTFGSSFCDKHDRIDPACQKNSTSIPAYCEQKWCYIDKESCLLSDELLYPSDMWDEKLYYSYSVCNSSATAWQNFLTTDELAEFPVLEAVVPGSNYPFQYKLTESGRHAEFAGVEYYDNSIPYQGALIDYLVELNLIMDLGEIKLSFRSKGSDRVIPDSSYTSSVRDVQVGLADIGVGAFWVTAERLRMTSFTTQIGVDTTVLVMPRNEDSFWSQITRVMEPFDDSLWILLFFVLLGVSALSLLFASPLATNTRPWNAFRDEEWRASSNLRRVVIFTRHLLEAFLQKGVFCFGAASDQDFRSSLSMKFLIFGFSCMILVVVSAYTANLAAFLTQSAGNYVDTVEKAIDRGYRICAHPAIINTFRAKWPDGRFVHDYTVSAEGNIGIDEEYFRMIKMFDEKRCEVLAWGEFDFRYNAAEMGLFCERNLVVTKNSIHDIPIAMPVKKDIAAAVSYLMFEAERQHDITFMDILRNYEEQICNIDMDSDSSNGSGSEKMTISNMAFPFIMLALCIVIALTLKLCNRKNVLKCALCFTQKTNMSEKNTKRILEAIKFAHFDIDHHHPSCWINELDDESESEPKEKQSYHRGVSCTLRTLKSAVNNLSEDDIDHKQQLDDQEDVQSSARKTCRSRASGSFRQSAFGPFESVPEEDMVSVTSNNSIDEEAIKAMIGAAVESSTLRLEESMKAFLTKAISEKNVA